MSNHSFFRLTPYNDHVCVTPAELAEQEHLDFWASLSKAEHDALLTEAMTLGDHIQCLIDTYCDDHHETSYGLIIEALRYVRWCVERDMAADTTDD